MSWSALHRFPHLFRLGLLGGLLLSCFTPLVATAVTLQLKWYHQFQFAGYYAAEAKGYYKEAGLEVRIQEGTPQTDVIDEVLSGRAQFGVFDSYLLLARAEKKPVVVLGAIFQHSPQVLMVRSMGLGKGIQDLVGMRVMMSNTDAETPAFLSRSGVPRDRLTIVPHSFNIQDLIEGRVDAATGYDTNETYILEKAGFPFQLFTPRSAGIDFYGDNLFTSEEEIRNHPEVVKAFRAASMRGWNYALAHPEEIVDLIHGRYSSQKSQDQLLYEARRMATLMQSDLVEIGYMNPGRWREIADSMAEVGLAPKDISLTGFLYNPEPPQDLTWLLRGAAALLALGAILFVHQTRRANLRLKKELLERAKIEGALQASTAKYRSLVEEAPVGIFLINTEGQYLDANPAACALTSYSLNELQQMHTFDLVPEDDLEASRRRTGRLGEEGHLSQEIRLKRKGGSIRWVSLDAAKVGEGNLLAFCQDITSRKEAEAALRANEAILHQSQKLEALGVMVSGVAHNINNVLAAILATASVREESVTEDQDLEAWGRIATACRRGRDVVKSLSQFARPTLSTPAPLELHALIREVRALLESTARSRIRIGESFTGEPLWLLGDAGSLNHALMNLCINAMDAMPNGGTITLQTSVPEKDWVEVAIEDDGEGMTPEILARVQEPFFTTKEVGKGTGLGLSLTHGVVKAHGGTLEISSVPDQGTTVKLRFPRIPVPAGRPVEEKSAPSLGSLNVLLVDDDEDVRFLVARMFKKAGHQVKGVASGQGALESLATGPLPDLVILDQNMPGLTGVQILERIRALHPDLPVLISSGQLDIEEWPCFQQPNVGILSKPFDMAELQAKLAGFTARSGSSLVKP